MHLFYHILVKQVCFLYHLDWKYDEKRIIKLLRAGIVGLPNVGKSTLFNALTSTANAQSANYPFCTIEPNVGVVTVPDERLYVLQKLVKTDKVVPTAIEFVDIAGLVKGASKGEGLGNQFLANIRETDAIIEVVRCFDDPNTIHVTGKVDPIDDIETINTELALADMASLEKRQQRLSKVAKTGDKDAVAELAVVEKLLYNNSPNGMATTIILLCVFGGTQLFCLGIIGEYVGQVYREVKARPRYIKDIELK